MRVQAEEASQGASRLSKEQVSERKGEEMKDTRTFNLEHLAG